MQNVLVNEKEERETINYFRWYFSQKKDVVKRVFEWKWDSRHHEPYASMASTRDIEPPGTIFKATRIPNHQVIGISTTVGTVVIYLSDEECTQHGMWCVRCRLPIGIAGKLIYNGSVLQDHFPIDKALMKILLGEDNCRNIGVVYKPALPFTRYRLND